MPSRNPIVRRTGSGSWVTQAILPERQRMVQRAKRKQDFARFDFPAFRRHGIMVETAASPIGETLDVIFPKGKYNFKGFAELLRASIKEKPQLSRLMRFLERKVYPKERAIRSKNPLYHLTGEPSVEQGYIRIGNRDYLVVADYRKHDEDGSISVHFFKTTAVRKLPKKFGDLTASAHLYFNAYGDYKTHVGVWNPMAPEATALMRFLMHDSLVVPK